MKKSVDIGFGYVKWTDSEQQVLKRQALVTEIPLGALDSRSELDTIIVDGVEYIIGKHEFVHLNVVPASSTRNRVEDLEYKILFLYPLAVQASGEDLKTDIVTGLPIQTMEDEAPLLVDLFSDKEFDIEFRGSKFKISIDDVIVMPQGYAANLYLLSSNPTLKKENVLVADVGFQTVNYVYMQKGNVFNELADTHPSLGIGSAYDEIGKIINRRTRGVKNYTKYDVDSALDHGVTIINKNSQEEKLYFAEDEEVLHVLDKQARNVWADIKWKYIDRGHLIDKVVFLGGSSERMENQLKENSLRKTLFPESPQDLQVLGYDMYARSTIS
ncbi:hypothetical protein J45TS6_47460 [Paenibacillus sp. J45TS6]|uniref:ParM/StbA family protein n=1 Tax=unclassified Paenibacillus TaxID=185978 RepID=UPI001B118717|nr:ParM/StbA family protein [Paenibacillus sp. J45TS6]GIP46287.1 hypothetical protein J45TS6_47460 [Paenibacillus sp. J45TS6]